MDIYDLAAGSLGYANKGRDLEDLPSAIAEGINSRHSLTADEFVKAMKSPEQKGSIVFGRLDPNWTESFAEYEGDTGFQTAKEVKPFRKMELPSIVEYGPKGAMHDGLSVSGSLLRESPDFHDWMKTFAQNLKETAGEGAILPRGTQELLDAPTMEEGSRALRAYLESTGQTADKPNARLLSIMPDQEGLVRFGFDNPDGTFNTQGLTYRERVDKFVNTTNVPGTGGGLADDVVGLSVGSTIDDLPTQATIKSADAMLPPAQRTSAAVASIASNAPVRAVEEAVPVAIRNSRATGRLLGAATEASAAVAGGTANAGALRAAGAVLNLLT